LPVAGSTWTTGLSAPSGLVDNDHRREALRVRFTADGEADASEGAEGGGGGGEAGGEAMILYTITYSNIQNVNFHYRQLSTSTVLYVSNLE